MTSKYYLTKKCSFLVLSTMFICFYYYYFKTNTATFDNKSKSKTMTRDEISKFISKRLTEAIQRDKGTGCELPKTDPFAEETLKYMEKRPKIVCKGFDWVRCNISNCAVRAEILDKYKQVTCTYQDILFESDNAFKLGPSHVIKSKGIYLLTNSDQAQVSCTTTSSPDESQKLTWKSVVRGFRSLVTRVKPRPGREDTLNVVVMGFDSAAKDSFIRLMPKSYKFMVQDMEAVVLNGYNIVGEGTPATLFPFLLGKNELELPDRRKAFSKQFMDNMPFIFYKLRDDGYRTAYFEDMLYRYGGTFQYRFTGFKKPPTDHYLRQYFYAFNNHRWAGDMKKYCVGDTPSYQAMLNATEEYLTIEGKKFIFTFISDISHDDIYKLSNADDGFTRFLQNFKSKEYLNNTMLIVMGDHGPRFGKFRQTFLGKMEERHPLMAIMLPKRLIDQRPDALLALKHNADVLTTPHDLHATVLDVVDMREHWNPLVLPGADRKRGLTLLERITKRSCGEAGIQSHWCRCMTWIDVSKAESIYNKSAFALIDFMNNLTEAKASLCVPRTLISIFQVQRHSVSNSLLEYSKQIGLDGYLSSFQSRTKIDEEEFFVKVAVRPGYGVYEATVIYIKDKDTFEIDPRAISRINAYSDEPDCISRTHPHLRRFCYCLSKL